MDELDALSNTGSISDVSEDEPVAILPTNSITLIFHRTIVGTYNADLTESIAISFGLLPKNENKYRYRMLDACGFNCRLNHQGDLVQYYKHDSSLELRHRVNYGSLTGSLVCALSLRRFPPFNSETLAQVRLLYPNNKSLVRLTCMTLIWDIKNCKQPITLELTASFTTESIVNAFQLLANGSESLKLCNDDKNNALNLPMETALKSVFSLYAPLVNVDKYINHDLHVVQSLISFSPIQVMQFVAGIVDRVTTLDVIAEVLQCTKQKDIAIAFVKSCFEKKDETVFTLLEKILDNESRLQVKCALSMGAENVAVILGLDPDNPNIFFDLLYNETNKLFVQIVPNVDNVVNLIKMKKNEFWLELFDVSPSFVTFNRSPVGMVASLDENKQSLLKEYEFTDDQRKHVLDHKFVICASIEDVSVYKVRVLYLDKCSNNKIHMQVLPNTQCTPSIYMDLNAQKYTLNKMCTFLDTIDPHFDISRVKTFIDLSGIKISYPQFSKNRNADDRLSLLKKITGFYKSMFQNFVVYHETTKGNISMTNITDNGQIIICLKCKKTIKCTLCTVDQIPILLKTYDKDNTIMFERITIDPHAYDSMLNANTMNDFKNECGYKKPHKIYQLNTVK
jgi:hypothetical protein